jgi:hypothetical protein
LVGEVYSDDHSGFIIDLTMKKSAFLPLAFAILIGLQSCKSDPNGPGEPVIMTSIYDSSLVDVVGEWQLVSIPSSTARLEISSSIIRSYFGGQLQRSGKVDDRFNRTVVIKTNGYEHSGTIYGINFNERPWSLAVATQDTVYFGPCDVDTSLAQVTGKYVRVK